MTNAKNQKCLFVLADWMQGIGLSGGDRIFIELIKRWQHQLNITLLISKEGAKICRREGLGQIKQKVWASDIFSGRGYLIDGLYRTLIGLLKALTLRTHPGDVILSSSDFWPDSLPAFLIKLKNPKVQWIASFYLFAPKPWDKNSPYKGTKWIIGFYYWLSQLPIYLIIKRYSDIVFVTSEPDIPKFVNSKKGEEKIIAIRGGVDTRPSENYFECENSVPLEQRKYDACFIGRFHYQKGVLELLQIWKSVCKRIPQAKLAMVGLGPLESEIRRVITKLELHQNIELLGYKDGLEKYNIFKQSKIVVHPATFDSGGMAAAEAMAWGLPAVGFDLKALKTYYPKGMLKTKCFEREEFAENINQLLSNTVLYDKLSQSALDLIRREWEWDTQAKNIFNRTFGNS